MVSCLGLLLIFIGVAGVAAGQSLSSSSFSLLRFPLPLSNTSASQTGLYASPEVYNKSLIGPLRPNNMTRIATFDIASEAECYVAQWNNPNPITDAAVDAVPNSQCQGGSLVLWSKTTASSRVCASKQLKNGSSIVIELASTGGNTLPCGTEFDMFLSPLDGAYPAYQPTNFDDGVSLSEVSAIALSFRLQMSSVDVQSRCGKTPQCSASPDYVYLTIGLPLRNPLAQQTIFYQIEIYDSRWNDGCGFANPCVPGPVNGSWYFSSLPTLGVNFNIANFPGAGGCIQTPEQIPREFSFTDLLPSFKRAVSVAADRYSADSNLENWSVGSAYIGSGLQGQAGATLQLSDIDLSYHV